MYTDVELVLASLETTDISSPERTHTRTYTHIQMHKQTHAHVQTPSPTRPGSLSDTPNAHMRAHTRTQIDRRTRTQKV